MKLSKSVEAIGCIEQLKEFYENKNALLNAEILKFSGIDGSDVYNPSIPFEINGEIIIAGRVESRHNEVSQTMFFIEKNGEWVPRLGAPVLNLQDPFVTKIGDEVVVGGVYVEWDGDRLITYHTNFYKGKTLEEMTLFLSGPTLMKDVRIVELQDKRIGVFSRPQGQKMIDEFGCFAKIGFVICQTLDKITAQIIEDAPLLEGHFISSEWGGCNQLHILKNGLVGVIGHKSYMDGEPSDIKIHYHGTAFVIDPNTREMSQSKIISTRKCFPDGPSKNSRAWDVTFTSGIIRNTDGTATLYTGLSDCQVGKATIKDPFVEYEN